VDVALIGVVGYAAIAVVALLGTVPGLAGRRGISSLLLALAIGGVLFTWRLKYGEWVVLKVFCIWCFESFVTIHLCLVLAWLDWRRTQRASA
jgi:uncharacterized membrane protein